jgi:hypothetical protein
VPAIQAVQEASTGVGVPSFEGWHAVDSRRKNRIMANDTLLFTTPPQMIAVPGNYTAGKSAYPSM